MKKKYEKPMISVEELQMDAPIALNCEADKDDMYDLIELGYFGDASCDIKVTGNVDYPGYDTICYHSNIYMPFTS